MGELVKIVANAIKFNLIHVTKNRHKIYTQYVIIVPNMTILGQNMNEQFRLTEGRTKSDIECVKFNTKHVFTMNMHTVLNEICDPV